MWFWSLEAEGLLVQRAERLCSHVPTPLYFWLTCREGNQGWDGILGLLQRALEAQV